MTDRTTFDRVLLDTIKTARPDAALTCEVIDRAENRLPFASIDTHDSTAGPTIQDDAGDKIHDFAETTLNNVSTIDGSDGNDVPNFTNSSLDNLATIYGGLGDDIITGTGGV